MEHVTIQITGGGPFGFRLYGGEDDPLLVAKLRRRSKAHEAGLAEGDILLGINGVSCQKMSHSVAMGMIDASSAMLTLLVLRGTNDPFAVSSAYQALGSQLQQAPASSRPQETYQPSFQSQPMGVLNGIEDDRKRPSDSTFKREQRTEREGDATRQVTTETTKETFGGTTVTKVRRQEVTSFDPQVQQFQPTHSATPAQKPGVWQPSGHGAKPPSVVSMSAPSGVNVQHNDDRSFTLSFGFGSDQKENISPHQQPQQQEPLFKVNKVQNAASKPGTWQPAHVPAPAAPAPAPAPMEVEPEEPDRTHDVNQAPIWGSGAPPNLSSDRPKAFHLQRILIEGTGSGSEDYSGPDSPGGFTRMEHEAGPSQLLAKKLFGDSAFYDDPDHKYPTIEEQIKMARRVALSLTAPQNLKARGHTMFVKRAERADKWSTDHPGGPLETEDQIENPEYNPNPWKGDHTWKPTGQPMVPSRGLFDGGIPKPPPLPSNLFSTPTLPVLKYNKDSKTNAMSMEEIERMRLMEEKSTHNTVSPQVCFSLADDLRNMKGKGGKMFAKRKERSKKWDKEGEEEGEEDQGPDPDFLRKIGAVPMMGAPMMPKLPQPKKKDSVDGKPVNRLKEMIDPPKPKMTPWDAAAEDDGKVDQAFEHLSGYRPFAAHPAGLHDNLQKAALQQPEPAPVAMPKVPGKMPEGVKKIQGWGGMGASSEPSPLGVSAVTSSVSRSSFSSDTSSSFNVGAGSGGGHSPFKPVKFQLPGVGGPAQPSFAAQQPSSASSTPWSASPAPSTGSYGGYQANNHGGICDL
ncbi:hypothetical protein CAPTEDRAFT_228680 [Capitella teleta]|uniref:PDZ domain-containing protein n=1 Tax=Capitella teleta TaxID=283909 RepID=R7U9L0_CAPTE|nr:hypothetical protein CAPTEDRAFT_228680 [Capitella teleta]|eukprot:ELT99795.1 hypothetical protein CAPTEDRAFT_228680 [Capitella teleta]